MVRMKWSATLALIVLCAFLVACSVGPLACDEEAYVDSVDIQVRGAQYNAVVRGNYPDACSETGRITQRVVGKTIKVTLCTRQPDDTACAQILTPFRETIRLDVRGLSAGQYTVDVNGTVTTLTLTGSQ